MSAVYLSIDEIDSYLERGADIDYEGVRTRFQCLLVPNIIMTERRSDAINASM
jgi:hypothetical protein